MVNEECSGKVGLRQALTNAKGLSKAMGSQS